MSTKAKKESAQERQARHEKEHEIIARQAQIAGQASAEKSRPASVSAIITKADIQQLKSLRDDLCNRFKENESCLELARISRNRAGIQRSQRVCSKLTLQISALNKTIKVLELENQS